MGDLVFSYSIWRKQGVWSLLRHLRLVLLRRLHHALWDCRYDAFEAEPTSTLLDRKHLKPNNSDNLSLAREYTPSPRLAVGWILDGLKEDLSGFSFVDFGSGRGRVLLAAAERPFRKIRGIEFSQRLHQEATRNIAEYPDEKLLCKDLKSICVDAEEFELPDQDCVFYFYNPFDASLLEKVITNALDTAQARGNRILLVYYNPVHQAVVSRQNRLRAIPLPLSVRIKMKLFSPYPACVYGNIHLQDTA